MIKYLKDFDVKGKRILVRCDFNVPLDEKGEVRNNFRIRKSLPTINYLTEKGAKVVLLSHIGRFKDKLSLSPVQKSLSSLLEKEVKLTKDCKAKKETEEMEEGDILLLENVRLYKEEEENDSDFSKELSEMGDIYINDAFGCSHREHSSIVGIPNYLPSGAGLLLQKEITVLSNVLNNPWKPLVAVIGGVKISTKVKMIKSFLDKADHVLFGGDLANAILRVKGICVNKPWPEGNEATSKINEINITSPKVHLPIDVVVSGDEKGESYIKNVGPGVVKKEEYLYDIGPETVKVFSDVLKDAGTIIWAGPLGFFEKPAFEKGTREIGEKIIRNHKAYKVAGGGDTVFAITKFGLESGFDHVSTGGGAMLNFLSGEEIPGIKALEKNGNKES